MMETEIYQPPLPRNEDGTIKNVRPYQLCIGSHKVDGLPALLGDLHLDGRTCDCGRMIYKVEGCGCGNNKKELHGYPNEQ